MAYAISHSLLGINAIWFAPSPRAERKTLYALCIVLACPIPQCSVYAEPYC